VLAATTTRSPQSVDYLRSDVRGLEYRRAPRVAEAGDHDVAPARELHSNALEALRARSEGPLSRPPIDLLESPVLETGNFWVERVGAVGRRCGHRFWRPVPFELASPRVK
jgi:hypothetical protein